MPNAGKRIVFLIDMQSFYASIEKAANPALRNQPIVVAGDPQRRSGVVLAACPIAKSYGVITAEALWQAQQKCRQLVVVRPRMEHYLQVSMQITRIFQSFTDQVEPYSVDEQFLDVTGSVHLFGDPLELAAQIRQRVWLETGVNCRVGIGENKVLAKMACDNFAKKQESGIFWLKRAELADTLWRLPIEKLFGVGSRMKRHFHRMGVYQIGQLAALSPAVLIRHWGVNGEVLWRTAHGLDDSPVSLNEYGTQKGIGHHMTLPRDYHTAKEIKVVLLELCEEVCRRARQKERMGSVLSIGCRGANLAAGEGFGRQMKLAEATNDAMALYEAACRLFERHWTGGPVRSIGVTLGQLVPDNIVQLNLFTDTHKRRSLAQAMDDIRARFGQDAILRAASALEAGQAKERARKIGGHYK
ncbi:DNA polymerase IV 2 [Brevibacillus agri]|uniref:DNA polymerase IV n=1 Tax=Brevibacillus agri TaxID=51101 RepID=A0A3M8AZ22_9BACL|nr:MULTISPECIES: DNA polymerase IV [Brevibacillus]ELK39406.1 DNA polymerase IV [Brevibacillus agri BAB-2500]MBY0053998.1 DNA polymerase IV [Brevibacillus agri]MED1643447.1 DNA polymerase IV [Brevibacillus agri]MED1653536.1 DNA polymerase IV [Brevibacillus agri]MED1685223.1 DNA polymerase IV [Brevibacillus agri]